jgi:hypothetical protein
MARAARLPWNWAEAEVPFMTIYRLYQENGQRADFWVQHRSWSNSCARVISVARRESGRLPGAPPRYGEAAVVMLMFDVRSGRPLHDDQAPAGGVMPAAPARTAEMPAQADEAPRIGHCEILRLEPADRRYARHRRAVLACRPPPRVGTHDEDQRMEHRHGGETKDT